MIALGSGALYAAGVLASENAWHFDPVFRDETGLCAIERRIDGVAIKYTRQADLDAGLTVTTGQDSAPAVSTAQITYTGGQAQSYDVIMPAPGVFTLLPGSADGFYAPLTAGAGGFDISLGARTLRIDAAGANDLLLTLASCQGTAPVAPRSLIVPTTAAAEEPEEQPPETAPMEPPAALWAPTTQTPATPTAPPAPIVAAPAARTPAVEGVKTPPVAAPQPAATAPAAKEPAPDAQDVIRSWAQNDGAATAEQAPQQAESAAPPQEEKPAPPRHQLSEDDGGLERKLLEEWSEKIGLLEKENIALRAKAGASDTRLSDIRQDPMAQIREEALRKKVQALQEELEKAKTEAQKALSDMTEKIAAEPPPLPEEDPAPEESAEDIPAVQDPAPTARPPAKPAPGFGPPVPAYGPPAPPPGVESAIPFPSTAELPGPEKAVE
jgi:hypothetical protein